jgi:hypothetical protein
MMRRSKDTREGQGRRCRGGRTGLRGNREEVMEEGARVGGDAGLGLRATFIGARKPRVWQAGTRRRIGLGLVLEPRLPMGETRLG